MEVEIEKGQLWADLDPRNKGRLLRVVGVTKTHAICEVVVAAEGKANRRNGVSIRIDRLIPGSRGYKLIKGREDDNERE